MSPSTACERFCEVNNQTWTGRFTPETSSGDGAATAKDASARPAAPLDGESCQEAKDCRTITCQCVHGTAADVAACSPTSHRCGDPRVVCEHFCRGRKGKWSGKLVETAPALDARDLLGEPPNDDRTNDSDDF
jgi:hypothetical protein